MGAVMLYPESGKLEYAGAEVPGHEEINWSRPSTEQGVFQAQIAPLAMAMCTWCETLRGCALLDSVDNLSAIGALGRGYGPSLVSAKLARRFWRFAAEFNVSVWIDWVPGPSSLAFQRDWLALEDC